MDPDEPAPDPAHALRAQLERQRSEGAPGAWVASTLYTLVDHLVDARDLPGARAAHTELKALQAAHPDDACIELHTCLASACLLIAEGEPARAEWVARRAVKLGRRPELAEDLGYALLVLASAQEWAKREGEAIATYAEAAAAFEAASQKGHAATALLTLAMRVPDDEELALLKRAEALARECDSRLVLEWALVQQGCFHRGRDEHLPARRAFERAVASARTSGGPNLSNSLAQFAWFEAISFHNAAALALAEESLAAARTPGERGYALRARAEALGHLHRHREARADLALAARAFVAAGNPEVAKKCRRKALAEVQLIVLHLLPRWIFQGSDMSSLDGLNKDFHLGRTAAFFVALGVLGAVGWALLWSRLAGPLDSRALRVLGLAVGSIPCAAATTYGLLLFAADRAQQRASGR